MHQLACADAPPGAHPRHVAHPPRPHAAPLSDSSHGPRCPCRCMLSTQLVHHGQHITYPDTAPTGDSPRRTRQRRPPSTCYSPSAPSRRLSTTTRPRSPPPRGVRHPRGEDPRHGGRPPWSAAVVLERSSLAANVTATPVPATAGRCPRERQPARGAAPLRGTSPSRKRASMTQALLV